MALLSLLSIPTIAVAIAVTAAVTFSFLVLHSVVRAATSPLKHIPGPLEARFSKFWYFRRVYTSDFHSVNVALHRQHGPVVRISPNQYTIDCPEAVKQIYGLGTDFTKSSWYEAWGSPEPDAHQDIFSDRHPKRHSAHRRMIANLYSMTNLVSMEYCVNENIDILMQRFRELAAEGKVLNLQDWLQFYAHDVIMSITVGKRYGVLDKGDDEGLFRLLEDFGRLCARGGVYRELHKAFLTLVTSLKLPVPIDPIIKFTDTQIEERARRQNQELDMEKEPTSEDDFLARLFQLHEQEPERFSRKAIQSIALMNIFAGNGTTSISLCAIMYSLLKNPRTFEKLRAEIDNATSSGLLSRPVTYQQSQQLPYLQAVIKEAVRLHPAAGLPLSRVVPPAGATIAGHFFPAGTEVGINAWVAHRNPSVFGLDAEAFIPERWLTEDKEALSRMDRYFLAFGAGSRSCIGKNISLLEMGKLIPELVREFDFSLVKQGMVLETEDVWFVKQTNILCRVKVRGA